MGQDGNTPWRNKLIWGDNKYVLASLLEGDKSIGLEPLAGKVDLIYIDPPFATGANFSFRAKVGDQEIDKAPSAMEACDRSLELDFARFLESDEADDVLAYFKNETAMHFDIEYQSVGGGIRKYRPDFVVRCGDGCMYVVETKGLEDLEVERKDMRTHRWCEDASGLTGQKWRYVKVPEGVFRAYPVRRFGDLVAALER